jgi:hypothetical protein
MKTLKKVLFISFFIGISFIAHAIDDTVKKQNIITPENSTLVYYTVAEKAYLNLKGKYGALPDNTLIETGVTKESALDRLYSAFSMNVLKGCHPGMAERDWHVRGGAKWGNQQLLKIIVDIYGKDYNPNPEIQIFDPLKIDTIAFPFMKFGVGYEPKPYDQMDEVTKNFVTRLREEYPAGAGEGCCIS